MQPQFTCGCELWLKKLTQIKDNIHKIESVNWKKNKTAIHDVLMLAKFCTVWMWKVTK